MCGAVILFPLCCCFRAPCPGSTRLGQGVCNSNRGGLKKQTRHCGVKSETRRREVHGDLTCYKLLYIDEMSTEVGRRKSFIPTDSKQKKSHSEPVQETAALAVSTSTIPATHTTLFKYTVRRIEEVLHGAPRTRGKPEAPRRGRTQHEGRPLGTSSYHFFTCLQRS